MITVNTNLTSLTAQRSLLKSTNSMNTALQRMSTGVRINSSKDDAAGMAISNKLEYKTSSLEVANDNAQMGQSMLNTAEGSLGNINDMLVRIRDLTEQAANGTYGKDELKAMQSEIDALTQEIYRVKNSTEFNGKYILGNGEKYTPKDMDSFPTKYMEEINTIEDLKAIDKSNPIAINSAEELKKLADLLNSDPTVSTDRTFCLTSNIDLSELGDVDGKGSNWTKISNFYGTFDGNGFTISNLTMNTTGDQQGLFGRLESGSTAKNINFNNVNISGNGNALGALAGRCLGTVENCNVSGTVSNKGTTGGLVGILASGQIFNSCSTATVSGGDRVGGIVGSLQIGTVSNCSSTGSITGTIYVGGLIGYSKIGEILNSTSSSTVTNSGKNTGGLVGYIINHSTISNCSSTGTVTGSDYTGGLTGYCNNSTISNCSSTGTATSTGKYTGGLVGVLTTNGTISNSSSSATVNGNNFVGGLVGQSQTSSVVSYCSSTGTVTGTEYVGGLIGTNIASSSVDNSKTTSTVKGTKVGAFAGGTENASFSDCEYNPTINIGMEAVGYGSSTGVTENEYLVIDNPKIPTTQTSTKTNLQVGITSDDTSVITVDTGFTLGNFNIYIANDSLARKSLDDIDAMIAKVSSKLTEIGAVQNRLESTMESQEVQKTALTSANSLIKDADIAEESANYVKNQILQQTTASLLATANQSPAIALQLV